MTEPTMESAAVLAMTNALAIPSGSIVVTRASHLGMRSALMQAGCLYGYDAGDANCDCPSCCALTGRRVPGTCQVCGADITRCICDAHQVHTMNAPDLLRECIPILNDTIKHNWGSGLCPDGVDGHDRRNPDCPVCRVLIKIESLLDGEQ